eukprot:CAMPEP_0172505996 /NCGR_PEP_ID=MMETSP1066-20121228/191011_1 /TAXON_ID=671091 /ORGANISM="Coscinodiscus wailesii, Strain CCMP2513" /LENGTH=112 /DNA_ID=CAMNT_0013282831 /DNA_START=313 /DNA_END=651 /DNA_ORIENTATION=+
MEGNNLLLTPTPEGSGQTITIKLSAGTQFKKPKNKRYPWQFGMKETVYTTVLLEPVIHAPTGYAPSPLDPANAHAFTEGHRFQAKLGSMDLRELEKLLLCLQAATERCAGLA